MNRHEQAQLKEVARATLDGQWTRYRGAFSAQVALVLLAQIEELEAALRTAREDYSDLAATHEAMCAGREGPKPAEGDEHDS